MIRLFRGQKASSYIFFEILPAFLLGLIVFISIILIFQVLRLTEFVLVHGVNLQTAAEILGFVAISLLPALLPMALLFSIIMTYGRLSADSEIIALRACGFSLAPLISPAIVISLIVSFFSAQTSFNIGPWGNRQFELLFTRLGNTKAAAVIKEGTFTEGFFDMVVYANEVDSKNGILKKIFIFDEKAGSVPLAIVAKSGRLVPDPNMPGHKVLLRLEDGEIHRQANTHTTIHFDTSDIQLLDPVREELKEKSLPSLTLTELYDRANDLTLDVKYRNKLQVEKQKRWSLSVLCLVFGLLGVALGTDHQKRQAKTNAMLTAVVVILIYWTLYLALEGAAHSAGPQFAFLVWIPNFLGLGYAVKKLRKM